MSTCCRSSPPVVTFMMCSQAFSYLKHSLLSLGGFGILLPTCVRYRLGRDLSFSFGKKASFDPLFASTRLPRHGALVAKLSFAPAGDVVTPHGQLDDRMTFRAPLPAVRLHECADDGRIVVWFAEEALRVRSLATMSACRPLAGWTCNATAECINGAKERRTRRLWTVPAILRRCREF